MSRFTISKLAKAAGVGIETVRYYEKRGLVCRPKSTGSFREYSLRDADRIRFIKRGQELGFTLVEIQDLLDLADSPQADRGKAKGFAIRKVELIRSKIVDLQAMEQTLSHLVDECSGHGPVRGCPIIEALSGRTSPGTSTGESSI